MGILSRCGIHWARWRYPCPTYDAGAPLYSIHIPKCGGTSVKASLAEWFDGRLFFHYADEAAGSLPELAPWQVGSCVHGHFNRHRGFGVLDYYPEATQFIAFLRDPFELHVSLYFYLKQHALENCYAGQGYDVLDEFPDLTAFIDGLCANRQHPYAVSLLRYMPWEMTWDNYRTMLMSRFIHVGITEELGNSLAMLAKKLGTRNSMEKRLNVSRHDESVDMGALRCRHGVHFALEHAIYRFACDLHRHDAACYL